jgi:hypothetical protein
MFGLCRMTDGDELYDVVVVEKSCTEKIHFL